MRSQTSIGLKGVTHQLEVGFTDPKSVGGPKPHLDSRESYTNLKLVSLTRSQLEVQNLARLDPRSSGWTRAILDIESTTIYDASIGLAMVSIHIFHLIGQTRGTSHEFETPWVGCIRGIDQREVNQLNNITMGQKNTN